MKQVLKTIRYSMLFTIVALIVISTSLSACGLKRDLYLPEDDSSAQENR